MAEPTNKGTRIRDWKGLLASEPKRTKYVIFALLLLLSAGMTFTQFGFIGMGTEDGYLGYCLGLLAPITLCALLLGKGPGTLFGLLSGAILLIHSHIQPLDLYEYYFVAYLNSLVLYTATGFFLGLFFAIALRKDPKHHLPQFAFISIVVSVVSTAAFLINAIVDATVKALNIGAIDPNSSTPTLPTDTLNAIAGLGRIDVQIVCDALIIFFTAALGFRFAKDYLRSRGSLGVRTVFQTRLFVALMTVFIVVQAGSYAIITVTTKESASRAMGEAVEFICNQVKQNYDYTDEILSDPEFSSLSEHMQNALLNYDPSQWLVEGYDLASGALVVFLNDTVLYSDSSYYVGSHTIQDYFGEQGVSMLEGLSESGQMRTVVYGVSLFDDLQDLSESEDTVNTVGELGYMRATKKGDFIVIMIQPASRVFANRLATMNWATLLALALVAAVFAAVARLLTTVVIEPMQHVNGSLSRIIKGDLNELVTETDTVEFASFSAGINSTVGALRGLIDESERRMENDLATAKAIQESALPRTFPPFPEIDSFDIYASMNAAKEVGGDFYDFFLIDEHTLGFLIADVSGKGIPGALFMMAAKTEIENYLSTGMSPAEAIASANKRLCANNDAGMFVTVWAASLDFVTGELTYVNAGHNFPLLRHGHGGEWEWLKEKCGLFLGTFETAKYRQKKLVLSQGDELLLYTDGVNEAFSINDEEFGNDRLEGYLGAHADLGAEELVHGLRAEVAAWAEGAEQSDDITILALEYGSAPEASDELTLPATLDSLGAAVNLISDELERRLCPVSIQHKVEVALEELFVNVCRYAYADAGAPGEVTVSYTYQGRPSSITVELRDLGVPFDPVSLKDPTKPANIQEAKIGGLGILMVRRSMDEFTYQREGDANVVTFKKQW